MAQPLPVQKHKSTLFLLFSPKCKPFAELAAWNLSKSQYALKIGINPDLLETESSLIIPQGDIADCRTVLRGKVAIARFFARSNKSLYNEDNLAMRFSIDSKVDLIRNASKETHQEVCAAILEKSDSTHLNDLLAWDYALNNPLDLKDILARFNSVDAFTDAQQLILDTLETAPIIDIFKYEIVAQIEKITGAERGLIFRAIAEPREKEDRDVCLAVPSLKLPGNVIQIGKDIAAKFQISELIKSVSAAGVFLNFAFNRSTFRKRTIIQAIKNDKIYGNNSSELGNLAVIEFSSPNIAKPFHAGHLRSTIIGNFVKNILAANGSSTLSMNYLGDWGKQYGLLAIGFEKYGSEAELKEDPIKHLYEVYVKINTAAAEDPEVHDAAREYFSLMESGNTEALGMWQKFRDLSIVKYKEMYERLNISFDVYSGESQYSLSMMKEVLEELQEKALLVPDNGALIVDLKSYGIGTAVIGKSDGSMLYLSRDIAAAQARYRAYAFDSMYYCVGVQQDHHFRQLFKILELTGKTWAPTCHHIPFGMIEGMSTRKGTVVFLKDILDTTQDEMHKVMKANTVKYAQIADPVHVSDVVGISSIMIQDMSARRIKDYEFNWSRMLSFEGDTGPYLQYAHARLCSIERAAGVSVDASNLDKVDWSLLSEPQAHNLIDHIAIFSDTIHMTGQNKEPITLVKYCLRLSHFVSSALTDLYVVNQPTDIATARLAMYKAARIALGNGLRLLGLSALERM